MVRDLCSKRTAADKIMNKMNENRKIVLDTLNEQNIEYEMFEHQAVYTVDEIEDSDLWNHENGIGAKNLFLRDGSGKHHFLVIIREDKQVEYSLVRELGRLDAPGRPILLGTTEEFLRCFGVQDLESLPVPDPVQIEDFKAEAEEEIQLKLDV